MGNVVDLEDPRIAAQRVRVVRAGGSLYVPGGLEAGTRVSVPIAYKVAPLRAIFFRAIFLDAAASDDVDHAKLSDRESSRGA